VTGGARSFERCPFRRSSRLGSCGRTVAGRLASPPAVLLSLSEIDPTSSATWVTRSLGPCGLRTHLSMSPLRARRLAFRGPRGLPRTACTHAQKRAAPFTLGVTPASGSHHLPLARRRVTTTLECLRTFPGFCPLRRSQRAASTCLPRLCLARYVPSPGTLTLLTVSSATHPVGLFHPTGAHGVPPFRATYRRAGTSLDARCPPDVSPADRPRRHLAPSASAEPWLERSDTDARSAGSRQSPPSGLCSLRRPGTSPPWFRWRRARKLSWGSSSPGASPLATRSTFHVQQLPWGSHRRLPNRSPADGRSATLRSFLPRRLARLSRDPPPLMRFPTFSRHSTVRERARPELMCSLRAPSHVAVLWQALYGSSRVCGSPRPGACASRRVASERFRVGGGEPKPRGALEPASANRPGPHVGPCSLLF